MDLTRLAFSTRAALAIAPMQDFLGLGSAARMNTPGTPVGNWQWRLREELLTPELRARVRGLVADTGRL